MNFTVDWSKDALDLLAAVWFVAPDRGPLPKPRRQLTNDGRRTPSRTPSPFRKASTRSTWHRYGRSSKWTTSRGAWMSSA